MGLEILVTSKGGKVLGLKARNHICMCPRPECKKLAGQPPVRANEVARPSGIHRCPNAIVQIQNQVPERISVVLSAVVKPLDRCN